MVIRFVRVLKRDRPRLGGHYREKGNVFFYSSGGGMGMAPAAEAAAVVVVVAMVCWC